MESGWAVGLPGWLVSSRLSDRGAVWAWAGELLCTSMSHPGPESGVSQMMQLCKITALSLSQKAEMGWHSCQ